MMVVNRDACTYSVRRLSSVQPVTNRHIHAFGWSGSSHLPCYYPRAATVHGTWCHVGCCTVCTVRTYMEVGTEYVLRI